MWRIRDILLCVALLLSFPLWMVSMVKRQRLRTDWRARLGHGRSLPSCPATPRVLLHGVSVGEISSLKGLADELANLGYEIVISSTTDTGFRRAQDLYANKHTVVRWPLDFGSAVRRFLNRIQPDLIAMAELEVWPEMTRCAQSRGIPSVVISGRLSARSHRRYRLIRPLIRPMFKRLSAIAVQDESSAARFCELGVPSDRVEVVGSMKWDSASKPLREDSASSLAEDFGIDPNRPLIVGGSTAPGEELLLKRATPPETQLMCAPRRPEWWDEAAKALSPCSRRSQRTSGGDRFLLDTIGELSHAYALADIVVVGRSFGNLHGSDPIEPIARGAATIIGPETSDFELIVQALISGGGLIQCTKETLAQTLETLCKSESARMELVTRGQAVIQDNQGATNRCASLIASHIKRTPHQDTAASS